MDIFEDHDPSYYIEERRRLEFYLKWLRISHFYHNCKDKIFKPVLDKDVPF